MGIVKDESKIAKMLGRVKIKILIMAVLLGICCFVTYYFHVIFETGVVFSHFFYIPIILAALWWKKKGLVVAIFLAALLISSHFFIRAEVVTANDLIRAFMFIIVSLIVTILSEHIAKVRKEVKREKVFSANIIATVPDSLIVLDKDLRIKKANLSFQKVFGIKGKKAIGTRIIDILGDEDGKLSNALSKLFGTKTTIENFELCYYSEKLGERIFNIAARGIIQAEQNGEEEVVLVVIGDITESKRAERMLQRFGKELELEVDKRTKELVRERDRTRHLIESSPDFQISMDMNGRIIDVNEAFEHMVDKGREELIGSSIYKYLPKKETEKAIAEIFEKGKVRNIVLTVDILGKGNIICNLSGTVFTVSKGRKGIYITGRDITKREKAEEKIKQQNIQLKRLNRIKSEFLNVTSHELRTPVTAMKGYIQMLLNQKLGGLTDEQQKALDIVLQNTNRLDNLIQDILDTSLLESGSMKFSPEKTDLNPLMKEIAEAMQPSADIKGLTINLDVKEGIPELVIDQDRIKQVVMNLVNNAIKFSADESVINVRVKKQEGNVLVEIQDYGKGIPKDKQKKVFEMFYQVDSGMDRSFGGTGLGLSISRGIVLGHGGKIWVESEKGKGSIFRFMLPIKPFQDVEGTFEEIDMFNVETDKEKSTGK